MVGLAPATRVRQRTAHRARLWLPWTLAALAIGAEIAFPLVGPGAARDELTIATVVVFALASLAHAGLTRGRSAALGVLVVAGGGGFAAEVVGTRTGVPFGHYTYTSTLGPRVLGVPLVIGLAWAMMAWPALLVGRRLVGRRLAGRRYGARRRWLVPLVAGWALASWDVFLDPQMVAAGHWRWHDVGRTLPGIPDVPLVNFAGWLLVGVALLAALDAVVPRTVGRDAQPYTLYLWTYGSSVLANLAFWHRPAVAAAGAVAMGVVAVPLAVSLWRQR